MGRPKKTDIPAKEKILNTASDLFFSQGYHQTGTNQIIEEAGVSKPTFYANFPTKEALGIAYVKTRAVESMKMITEHMYSLTDPMERYMAFYDGVRGFLISSEFRGCNFTNIAREFPDVKSPIRQEVIRFENEYREALRKTVRDLMDSDPKHFKKLGLTADQISDRYYLLLEGAITASASFHDVWPLDVAAKAVLDLVGMSQPATVAS